MITCKECCQQWRYGCPECATEFVQRHRNDTGHQMTNKPFRDDWRRTTPREATERTQRLFGRR